MSTFLASAIWMAAQKKTYDSIDFEYWFHPLIVDCMTEQIKVNTKIQLPYWLASTLLIAYVLTPTSVKIGMQALLLLETMRTSRSQHHSVYACGMRSALSHGAFDFQHW